MDDEIEVKVGKIETSLTYIQADITEMKADLKSLQAGLEQSAGRFSFIQGSWHTLALIVVIAWNVLRAVFGK